MASNQSCPWVATSDEGTSYCRLAEAQGRERDRAVTIAEANIDALTELADHVGAHVEWDDERMPALTMRGTMERERDDYAQALRELESKVRKQGEAHPDSLSPVVVMALNRARQTLARLEGDGDE